MFFFIKVHVKLKMPYAAAVSYFLNSVVPNSMQVFTLTFYSNLSFYYVKISLGLSLEELHKDEEEISP